MRMMVASRLRLLPVALLLATTGLDAPGLAVATHTAPGDQLWVNRLDVEGGGTFPTFSVGVSPDGTTVFVAGTGNDGLALVAYDAMTGHRIWVEPLKGFYMDSLVVGPDGTRVFVTGTDGDRYFTGAFDAATGTQVWFTTYNGGETDEASAISLSPDGTKVFVTGTSFESDTGYDYATVAYDANSGRKLWASQYNGPRNSNDGATSIDASPDGTRVFVTGYSPGLRTGSDYATVAYDANTGAQVWLKRVDRGSEDVAYSIGASPDGTRVFVTGQMEFTTAAYDAATGARLWATRYQDGYRAFSLGVSPDGQTVFVTGDTWDFSAYVTAAFDAATGARLWASSYAGEPTTIAYSVAVSPDGTKVFITGERTGSDGDLDYATVAYDAQSGSQLWATLYEGLAGGSDQATSIVASPDGRTVFVAGQSWGGSSGFDFATVAYSADG
jgi:WD40 repeat protein